MQDILPEVVLRSLRDHYYAGVTSAELGYPYNAADEDSVTGALGQALLTNGIRIVHTDGHHYGWRSIHYKFGGRGKGAPEKELGADGIFQLDVLDQLGNVVRRKSLLFQAKKEWRGKNRGLLEQAKHMAEYSPSAIVVDYRPSGFRGVAGREVIEAQGDRRAIPAKGDRRLAEILGDEFVRCRRGDVGVFWNPETKSLESDSGQFPGRRLLPGNFIETTVQELP